MKLSLITVCYNSSKTIEKTFKSVKNQTCHNFEYIVVDGASDDGTQEIIKNNIDIISQYVSEKDNGLYDAMNKGIKLSSGEIIGILNSDDTFYDDHVIEKIIKFHDLNDIQASVGNVIQINNVGKKIRSYTSKNWVPEKLKIGFMPPHPSIFFKKELFKKYGAYKTDYVIGADFELVVRFFLNNNISWKFSNITTTRMLIGGLSSSGINSYNLITKEMKKTLIRNNIDFSYFKIRFRFLWKFLELFK